MTKRAIWIIPGAEVTVVSGIDETYPSKALELAARYLLGRILEIQNNCSNGHNCCACGIFAQTEGIDDKTYGKTVEVIHCTGCTKFDCPHPDKTPFDLDLLT